MANTIQNLIDKGIDTFNCKVFGTKIFSDRPACKSCAKKYAKLYEACISTVSEMAKASKAKAKKVSTRVPGFWGYAQGSFTDLFCSAICEKPLTMNQAAAIVDPKTAEPIGPHPKCKKRLISENLAVFEDGKIYMRVYPKGHPEAGKLTNAAKIAKAPKKVEDKKAA